jgi:hypothetical protein
MALMLLIIAGALLLVLLDFARNVRALLEHRATNALWLAAEPPGLLDFEPDGLRATNRLNREFTRLAKDTGRLGRRLSRGGARLARAKNKSGYVKQRKANRTARGINRSAVYIEKRLAMLKKLIKEVERNNSGLIANIELGTDEERKMALALRDSLEGGRAASLESMGSLKEYRSAVEGLEAQNPSRNLRIACNRLGKTLGGVLTTLKGFEKMTGGLVSELDRRLAHLSKPARPSTSRTRAA